MQDMMAGRRYDMLQSKDHNMARTTVLQGRRLDKQIALTETDSGCLHAHAVLQMIIAEF